VQTSDTQDSPKSKGECKKERKDEIGRHLIGLKMSLIYARRPRRGMNHSVIKRKQFQRLLSRNPPKQDKHHPNIIKD
jgi:hypothetical protein